ncbi:GntR family transcriptional regulator [Sphingomonas sp. MMS24-JH45]
MPWSSWRRRRRYDHAEPRRPETLAMRFPRRAYAAHLNGLEAFAFFGVAILLALHLGISGGRRFYPDDLPLYASPLSSGRSARGMSDAMNASHAAAAAPDAGKGSAMHRVADELRRLALTSEEGTLLGSEEALMTRLGVSRPTLRQAAGLVAQDQLITIKRGVNGGYSPRPRPAA